jgi:hypothetical protein
VTDVMAAAAALAEVVDVLVTVAPQNRVSRIFVVVGLPFW